MRINPLLFILKWKVLSNQHIYWMSRYIKYMKPEAKKKKIDYIFQLKEQSKNQNITFYNDDVELNIKYYFHDKRVRDIDNYQKLIQDSMEWILFENDKQIKKLTLEKFIDKENPRVEILIKKY